MEQEENLNDKVCVVVFDTTDEVDNAGIACKIMLAADEGKPVRIAVREGLNLDQKMIKGIKDIKLRQFGDQKEYYDIMAEFMDEIEPASGNELRKMAVKTEIAESPKNKTYKAILDGLQYVGGEEFRERNCLCGLHGDCPYCRLYNALTLSKDFVERADILPPKTANKDLSYIEVSEVINGLRKGALEEIANLVDPKVMAVIKDLITKRFVAASKILLERKE